MKNVDIMQFQIVIILVYFCHIINLLQRRFPECKKGLTMIIGYSQVSFCDDIHSNYHILSLSIHWNATNFDVHNHEMPHLHSNAKYICFKRHVIRSY